MRLAHRAFAPLLPERILRLLRHVAQPADGGARLAHLVGEATGSDAPHGEEGLEAGPEARNVLAIQQDEHIAEQIEQVDVVELHHELELVGAAPLALRHAQEVNPHELHFATELLSLGEVSAERVHLHALRIGLLGALPPVRDDENLAAVRSREAPPLGECDRLRDEPLRSLLSQSLHHRHRAARERVPLRVLFEQQIRPHKPEGALVASGVAADRLAAQPTRCELARPRLRHKRLQIFGESDLRGLRRRRAAAATVGSRRQSTRRRAAAAAPQHSPAALCVPLGRNLGDKLGAPLIGERHPARMQHREPRFARVHEGAVELAGVVHDAEDLYEPQPAVHEGLE